MKIFIIGLLFTVLPLSAAAASPESDRPVTISVRVVDEQGAAIQRASIIINESQWNADTNGLAQTRTPTARLYTIRISGPGYYPMLHTYSEQERQQFKGQMPQVTLVKQIPGRVLLAFAGDAMLGRRYHAPNPGDPLLLDESSRLQRRSIWSHRYWPSSRLKNPPKASRFSLTQRYWKRCAGPVLTMSALATTTVMTT